MHRAAHGQGSRWAAVALVIFACSACSGDPSGPMPTVRALGPRIHMDLVRRHAAQLDDEDPFRPAGSQQEAVAAAYLLGHLQLAGYQPFLDAVPVENLVRSTNVVAPPPDGEEPAVVVVAPYDTVAGEPGGGVALGLLLELARVMNEKHPHHRVGFAALGAEHAEASGGRLGSRRLVNYLRDRDERPVVVLLGHLEVDGPTLSLAGRPGPVPPRPTPFEPFPARGTGEVFAAAGLRAFSVDGDARAAARLVLSYLEEEGV
jgi:Peptidase family M28